MSYFENEDEILRLKNRITALTEDIIQDIVGEVVPNIEDKKAEFIKLHSELRIMLGKEPRQIKNQNK